VPVKIDHKSRRTRLTSRMEYFSLFCLVLLLFFHSLPVKQDSKFLVQYRLASLQEMLYLNLDPLHPLNSSSLQEMVYLNSFLVK
jgi:hypothetical protein